MKYRWPGNVRELKNVIESAYQVNLGPILTADNLPERIVAGSGVLVGGELHQTGLSLTEMVNNFEKSIIAGAYAHSHGSLTAAAAAAVLVMGLLVTEYRTRRADTPAPDLEQMLATTPAETLRQAAAENYDDILYNQQL